MTKLTKYQKAERKEMKKAFTEKGGSVHFFPEYGVTIAAMPVFPGSRSAFVSVSVAAPTEEKLRKNVGEYNALLRMEAGEYLTVPFIVYRGSMEMLANTICRIG